MGMFKYLTMLFFVLISSANVMSMVKMGDVCLQDRHDNEEFNMASNENKDIIKIIEDDMGHLITNQLIDQMAKHVRNPNQYIVNIIKYGYQLIRSLYKGFERPGIFLLAARTFGIFTGALATIMPKYKVFLWIPKIWFYFRHHFDVFKNELCQIRNRLEFEDEKEKHVLGHGNRFTWLPMFYYWFNAIKYSDISNKPVDMSIIKAEFHNIAECSIKYVLLDGSI